MACDPNQLLEDAKCIMWCVNKGSNPAIIVSLWCQILDSGFAGETFYILTELGEIIDTEASDKLRQE